jgi:hypothetical protein
MQTQTQHSGNEHTGCTAGKFIMLPNLLVLQRGLQRQSAAASLKAVAEAPLTGLIHQQSMQWCAPLQHLHSNANSVLQQFW